MTEPSEPVSVIVPVRNRPSLLREAVASALVQDHPLEVVIVDDGSTDSTPAVADGLAAGDERVRVLHEAHGGPGAARNAGLRAARHPLVANLDSDDLMTADRLAHQVGVLVAHPEAVACVGAAQQVTTPGEAGPKHLVERWNVHGAVELAMLATILVRRGAILGVGGYDEDHALYEDVDLYRRLRRAGHEIVIDDHVVNLRRLHEGNLSHANTDPRRSLFASIRRGLPDRAS